MNPIDPNMNALYDSDQHGNADWQPDAETDKQNAVTVVSGKVVWDEITYIESSLYSMTLLIVCTSDNMVVLSEDKQYRVVIIEESTNDTTQID